MEPTTTPPARSLVAKLAEVMKEVGKIPKNGNNKFHGYKYVMESDLVEALREKLADRNIFITSSTKGVEVIDLPKTNKDGEIMPNKVAMLRVDYTFHDGDSAETITMESAGEIEQDGGKGIYKALTGSMKYFLMKNFLIATGDDPEQDTKPKPEPAKPVVPPKPPAPATPEQVAEITKLCVDTNTDPAKMFAFYKLTAPTAATAPDMIKTLKKKLSKQLDDAEKRNS